MKALVCAMFLSRAATYSAVFFDSLRVVMRLSSPSSWSTVASSWERIAFSTSLRDLID